jgi:hypothetical protein
MSTSPTQPTADAKVELPHNAVQRLYAYSVPNSGSHDRQEFLNEIAEYLSALEASPHSLTEAANDEAIDRVARMVASMKQAKAVGADDLGLIGALEKLLAIAAMQAARPIAPETMLKTGYDLAIAAIRAWKGHGLSASTDERLEAVAHDLEASRDAILWPNVETFETTPIAPVQDDDAELRKALDDLRVAADVCELDENQTVVRQATRIRAARQTIANRLGKRSLGDGR